MVITSVSRAWLNTSLSMGDHSAKPRCVGTFCSNPDPVLEITSTAQSTLALWILCSGTQWFKNSCCVSYLDYLDCCDYPAMPSCLVSFSIIILEV
ncbi:hypothetical protein M8J77_005354 [Diaphorina citri]|nr:hypothetical protein M8J77_005354 [Diaphorina citri]